MALLVRCGLALALVLGLSRVLLAQTGLTGASVEGSVRDASGAAVAFVTVNLTEDSTGVTRSTATDAEGQYRLAGLAVGAYRFQVERGGLQPLDRRRLVLSVGQALDLDVTLAPAFEEGVAVEREDSARGLGGAALSTGVATRAIEGLPANGRDYVAFTLLTPGVVAERAPPTGPTMSSGLSFAGQRARSNHFLVDGFDNDEVFTGAVAAVLSQDAVREFQVLAASASAEFGHASGGTVNTITKSGANEVRGSAFFYLRDERLNSRNHFERMDVFGNPIDVPKAPFHQRQWGGTLGGPLRKDRSFFFLSYEQMGTEASNFVTIDPAVASALERSGFPVPLGAAPYGGLTRSALAKVEHTFAPEHRLLFKGHVSRRVNEGIEPFGGTVARSHGAVQRRTDWALGLAQTDIFGTAWLNEARLQVVRGDQQIDGLDPLCGGPCHRPDQGGPEVTLPGLAVAGRQFNTPQPRTNLNLQVADTLTRFLGAHTFKAGFDLDLVWWDAAIAQDFGGRYVFTSLPAISGLTPRPLTALEAFEAGLPAVYLQGYGEPSATGASNTFSVFAQDRWRLSQRLNLEAGIRYQHYALRLAPVTVSSVGGTSLTYDVPARGDLSPRLSFSLDPTGRGRTALRGAFGLFTEDPLLAAPAVTEILDGHGLRLLRAGLPFSAEAWRAPGHRLPEPAAPFPSAVAVAGPAFDVPFARQVSLGLTQEMGRVLSLAVDLLAVRGKRQIGVVNFNPLVPSLGPGRRPNDLEGRPGSSTLVNQYTNYADSWYRGLALSLRKRMSHGFEALASYTLSKADDTGSDLFVPSNEAEDPGLGRDPADPAGLPQGFEPAAFRGPAAVDQRHRFVLSGLADLPWSLQLSGVLTLGSGRPFTALSGVDSNGDGTAANDRARRDPAEAASRVGRNGERLPAFATVDVRLARSFSLSHGCAIQLLAEAFNLFDRVNFSEVNAVFGPGAYPGSPQRDPAGRVTYGHYLKASAPRQVQLAARLTF